MRAPEGGALLARYAVAKRLHMTLGQLSEMPEDEFKGWLAYLSREEKGRGQ